MVGPTIETAIGFGDKQHRLGPAAFDNKAHKSLAGVRDFGFATGSFDEQFDFVCRGDNRIVESGRQSWQGDKAFGEMVHLTVDSLCLTLLCGVTEQCLGVACGNYSCIHINKGV